MSAPTYTPVVKAWAETCQKALHRFHQLPPRDRLALVALSSFVALVIVIYGMILPAVNFHDKARQNFQNEQALLHWLQEQRPAIQALTSSMPNSSVFSGSPLTLVNTSAEDFQLNIKRLQPENNSNLRVWMENVSFDNTLQWLHYLQSQGLPVGEISIDQQSEGLVNVRALF